MWMPRVAPMPQQAFAIDWIPPKQPAIFQLGVFLKMDAIHEHGFIIATSRRGMFYNFNSASVTAPSDADVTWLAYFASTPRV